MCLIHSLPELTHKPGFIPRWILINKILGRLIAATCFVFFNSRSTEMSTDCRARAVNINN